MHISAFGAALRTPDLRKKILFTLGLLGLYRLGAVLPTPELITPRFSGVSTWYRTTPCTRSSTSSAAAHFCS